ncbi:MAG TPA: tetratricopeptide repeat protein [Candidatus Sericytochromatia bacterium]
MVRDKPRYELHFHGIVQGAVVGDYNKVKNILQGSLAKFASLHRLPPDIANFTGRQAELESVTALLGQASKSGETGHNISVLTGMAGVGKSALAIHAAYQLKPDFPDAQLYVNLRGTESQPLEPSQVLAGFVRSLGVGDRSIPETLTQRSDLYRSLLSGKRALVLLDNALDEAQVRPLLPDSSTCAVIVTTRKPLADLEGAAILEVDEMTQEALDLLQNLVGVCTPSELEAAKNVIDLCSRLPLAIRITAGTLKNKADWRFEDCADKLADERERLLSLRLSDLAVRVSLALSYQELDANTARLFRLLGLLIGSNFTPALAGALLESESAIAEESVKHLVDVQLLEPANEGRYRFHDLVRLFARGQLAQEEASEARQAARLRISRWYLETSEAMDLALNPETRRQLAQVLVEGKNQSIEATEQKLFLAALNWFEIERTNVLASIEWANQAKARELVASLAKNLVNFFNIYGYWTDWEQTHLLALEAIRTLEDLPESDAPSDRISSGYREAQTLTNLGNVYSLQSDWQKASDCYEKSLGIFRELGDNPGIAKAMGNLANVYSRQGDWVKASDCYEQSLDIFRELKDSYGEGQTLANLGILYAQQSNQEKAIALWQEARRKLPSDLPKSKQLAEWLESTRRLTVVASSKPIEQNQSQRPTLKIVGGLIVVIAIVLSLIFMIF